MIPVTEARVLLPNASVSEVITYGDPQPIENAPDWVFGVITWRGWRIPLFSFSLMTGVAQKENFSGAKVAIIKALIGEGEMPFMAMLAQGFPRLTAVTTENLLLDGDQDQLPPGVSFTVSVNENQAFVPDLDGIEVRLMEILGLREVEDEPETEPVAIEDYPAEDEDDLDFDGLEPDVPEAEADAAPESDGSEIEYDALAVLDVGDDEALASPVEEKISLSFDDDEEEDPLAALDVNDDGEPLDSLDAELSEMDAALEMLDDSTDDDRDGPDALSDDSSDDDDDFDIDLQLGEDEDL
jgi:chemosensory pili system protein ChpC